MPTVAEAQEAAAKRSEPKIARMIVEAMGAAADIYQGTGQIQLPPDYRQTVEGVLLAVWGDAARSGARAVIGDFKADFGLHTKQDEESFFDQLLRAFAEAFGARKIDRIVDATREQINKIVLRGQLRGGSLPDIAGQIREAAPQIGRTRAHVIARTETHGSSNFAAHETAKTSRRPLVKEWMAIRDARTRDFGEGDGEVDAFNHRSMDGERVPLDQPFMVPTIYGTKEPLLYPGDPKGSPGNVIMCRCTVGYVRAE